MNISKKNSRVDSTEDNSNVQRAHRALPKVDYANGSIQEFSEAGRTQRQAGQIVGLYYGTEGKHLVLIARYSTPGRNLHQQC